MVRKILREFLTYKNILGLFLLIVGFYEGSTNDIIKGFIVILFSFIIFQQNEIDRINKKLLEMESKK